MTMSNVVPYQKRYSSRFQAMDMYKDGLEWMKEHRPAMYKRFMARDAANAIQDLSPEYQKQQQRLYAELEQEWYAESGCKLLGIEAGATKREVRNAYRRKARKLHPDVGGDAEAFKQLYAAYRAVLKIAKD